MLYPSVQAASICLLEKLFFCPYCILSCAKLSSYIHIEAFSVLEQGINLSPFLVCTGKEVDKVYFSLLLPTRAVCLGAELTVYWILFPEEMRLVIEKQRQFSLLSPF